MIQALTRSLARGSARSCRFLDLVDYGLGPGVVS